MRKTDDVQENIFIYLKTSYRIRKYIIHRAFLLFEREKQPHHQVQTKYCYILK